MTAEVQDRALRVPQVAALLQVSEGVIYKLAAAGQLRSFKVGRLLRIRESALQEFIAGQEA